MIKLLVLPSLLVIAASSAFATSGVDNSPTNQDELSDLTTYFLNLGGYLGYNLKTDPTDSGKKPVSQNLLNSPPTTVQVPPLQLLNNIVFNNFLGGSFLVNTVPGIAQI